jgi:DnaJ-class molecular chaperone
MYLTMGVLVICAVAGYLVSLRMHPFRRCHRCAGTGKHFGAFFAYSQRPCRHCGGNGRRPRYGNRYRTQSLE